MSELVVAGKYQDVRHAASVNFVRPKFLPDRLYYLSCEIETDPNPTQAELAAALKIAGNQFIKDMARQGWQHRDDYGYSLSLPHPGIRHKEIPSSFKGVGDNVSAYVASLPVGGNRLLQSESWSYFLKMAFQRRAIETEYLKPTGDDTQEDLTRDELPAGFSTAIHGSAREFLKRRGAL